MKQLLVKCGNFFFHHRNNVFPLLMLAVVLLIRPTFPSGNYKYDLLLDAVGVLVCLWGQLMRILAIGYFYIKRGGDNKQIYAGRLVQYGMFAHSRNPLYLGNILIFLGIVIIFNAPLAYVVGVPAVFFIYACIILAEENFLRGKFGGEFDDYASRVNRLWPNWTGFSKSIEGMTFRWKRVINKEYGTTFGWIYAALGIRAYALYCASPELYGKEIRILLYSYIPVVALYLLVRWMKKSGRLNDEDTTTMDT